MKILVLGKNSLLSNSFKQHTKYRNIKYITHKEIKKINFDSFTHIINFCFDPILKKKRYNKKNDFDAEIIKKINSKTFYINFSTRFVYDSQNQLPFSENDRCYSKNYYGKNKLIIEKNIIKNCKRYLILRLPTILIFSLKNKKLFSQIMLDSLKSKNQIFLDIKEDIYKDFITEDFFVKNIDILLKKQPIGIFNLSSGIGIKPIEIANNIIKGYTKGKIIIKKNIKKDKSFVMTNDKIRKITKIHLTKKKIFDFSINLGKKLITAK